jgi:ABC-type Fe3+-hydroxamate transport system substrate-binding protein
VGAAIGKEAEARAAVAALQARVDAVAAFVAGQPPVAHPIVGWMEWTEPIFVSL